MKVNIYDEYIHTSHYKNQSGVQASCADCHIPEPWIDKIVRKIKSSKEVLETMRGVIDTPEKFEQLRMKMAACAWASMKATYSRECRSCHNVDAIALAAHNDMAEERHQKCVSGYKTCIDCHKGIAHKLPKEFPEQEHARFVEVDAPCLDCHVDLDFLASFDLSVIARNEVTRQSLSSLYRLIYAFRYSWPKPVSKGCNNRYHRIIGSFYRLQNGRS